MTRISTPLSHENGDNWFYFEDQRPNDDDDDHALCARSKDDEPPMTIGTRSANGTTLIQFKYSDTPTHEVLRQGRCRFTGLVNLNDENRHSRHMADRNLEF